MSGLLVGIVWGFWHIPLWIISGYSGISLVLYVAYFLVSIVSTSLVITVFYSRQWNLLIPIWIHFLFNFVLRSRYNGHTSSLGVDIARICCIRFHPDND